MTSRKDTPGIEQETLIFGLVELLLSSDSLAQSLECQLHTILLLLHVILDPFLPCLNRLATSFLETAVAGTSVLMFQPVTIHGGRWLKFRFVVTFNAQTFINTFLQLNTTHCYSVCGWQANVLERTYTRSTVRSGHWTRDARRARGHNYSFSPFQTFPFIDLFSKYSAKNICRKFPQEPKTTPEISTTFPLLEERSIGSKVLHAGCIETSHILDRAVAINVYLEVVGKQSLSLLNEIVQLLGRPCFQGSQWLD